MKPMHLFRLALIGLFTLTTLAADEPAKVDLPKPDADGFITLFNGKDLTGWKGLEGYWSVKDDAITGSQTKENAKHTFLVLQASSSDPAKFVNFELHLKYRFTTTTGNSGVQFRSKMLDPTISKVGGYQADMDPNRTYDGGLYDEAGVAGNRAIMAPRGLKTVWDAAGDPRKSEPMPDLPTDRDAVKALVKPPGTEWNDMILTVNGNHFTINVNGHLMSDITDDSPKAIKEGGLIALQMHTGLAMTIQFKDIRIKLLDAAK